MVVIAERRRVRRDCEMRVRPHRTFVPIRGKPLTKTENYMLSLTVRGEVATVDRLKVVQAGHTTTTTTTDPSTTTSTTVSPPTTTTSSTTTTTTTMPPSTGSPGYTSPNWSGYVLTGASGGYQAIGAGWTVPPLNCDSVPNGLTTDWVGVNGFGQWEPGSVPGRDNRGTATTDSRVTTPGGPTRTRGTRARSSFRSPPVMPDLRSGLQGLFRTLGLQPRGCHQGDVSSQPPRIFREGGCGRRPPSG